MILNLMFVSPKFLLHSDFIEQCPDGSDERDCAPCQGVPGMVKCPYSNKCIR